MDYDFEAPTYVNFADIMDEDESEVSRYFDVEHEESFSRTRTTPGVILPGGPRNSSAKKKKSAVNSTSTPSNQDGSEKKTSPLPRSSKKSKTPAKRRSSGRLRMSVKTPLTVKTPGSVKRLGRGKPSSVTPGKVAAAFTALKLTPAYKPAPAPVSAKRSRKDSVEQSQRDSKRAKNISEVGVTKAITPSSSPALNISDLLQEALKTVNESARKVKRPLTAQKTARVDGIEVPCLPDKEHSMETRADKAARDPPIQLRSRSIVKPTGQKEDIIKSVTGPRVRSLSRERPGRGATEKKSRASSVDRLLHPTQASKANEPFVSLAEAAIRFQNKTPLRFRVKRNNSPVVKGKGPLLALRATIPQSPALRVKHRSRPVTALSREELEARELEEIRKNKIKPLPLPEKILRNMNPATRVEKKPPTQPEPFNLTEVRKKEVNLGPEPVKFTARPVPKKILEGPVGLGEKKELPLTEPKSPSFRANALKRLKEATQRITPLKPINKLTMKVLEENCGVKVVKEKEVGHIGVPNHQTTKLTTDVKPFSFEQRDKERIQKKEDKIRELQEQLLKKPTFHANPLPSFKTPPRLQRGSSPAARSRTPNIVKGDSAKKVKPQSGTKGGSAKKNIPEPKPVLMPQFKARAPTVLHRQPFEPVRPHRQLPLPDVTLASEIRAKDREAYDRHLMQREEELEAARQQLKAEKERKEKEEIALLRKQAVHKSNPAPKVKPFELQPSSKPLTDPNTPFCLKRSRKLSAV